MQKESYPSIYVTRDAPLIVREASARMHYGTVYMEFGGYIEIRTGSKFEIDNLRYCDDFHDLPNRNHGADYPTLSERENVHDWAGHHIIVTGSPGKNGIRGEDAKDWGEGGEKGTSAPSPGGNAPSQFIIVINKLEFNVCILSVGGAGGKGGDGGAGANGFDGESSEKPGGIGGDGGDGGNGSNSGNACSLLTIKYASKDGWVPTVDCFTVAGGAAGIGGIHGRNGKYYTGQSQPKNGSNGGTGIQGQAGKAVVEVLA